MTPSSSSTPKRSARLVRFGGVALATIGLSHFAKPALFESIVKPAFPRRTRQHVYTNGGIETAIGLGLISGKTRKLALVGGLGYLTYLGGSVARNSR